MGLPKLFQKKEAEPSSNNNHKEAEKEEVEMEENADPNDPEKKKKKKKKKKAKESDYLATEHQMTIEELATSLGTVVNVEDIPMSQGLPEAIAQDRLIKEGRNILSPPKKTPEIVKFFMHLANLLMVLLIVAGILSCIAYGLDTTQPLNLYLGIILFLVVLLDCIISYIQERNSSNVMKTFAKMLPQRCKVVRDGMEREVGVDELVRGDLVKFLIGDKIPADLRIIMSQGAKVECSSITGESTPISLVAEKTHERPTETRNLTFYGSLCLNGEGYGIVIRTADNTLIGSIAKLAGAQSQRPTTLQIEITHFVRFIAAMSFVMALIFFIIGMSRGQKFLPTFINGFIVVVVANVPQGLPATVTSVISIAAKKMAKKSVYVKRLDCVETLGSTSLVASDKTGTLTQNVMTVVSFWFESDFVSVNDGVNSVLLTDLLEMPSFKHILNCAALCNRARFAGDGSSQPSSQASSRMPTEHEDDHDPEATKLNIAQMEKPAEIPLKDRVVIGDASDTAIFRFVCGVGMMERLRAKHHKFFEIPFNSTIKYSVVIVDNPIFDKDHNATPRHTLYMKGAPEIIFAKCTTYVNKGETVPITEEFSNNVKAALRRSGVLGERVLAFAQSHIDEPQVGYYEEKQNFPTKDLTFLGLVSLIDPPRPNVANAIKVLKSASIKVLMVTGDHPITAESIARKVNIIRDGKTIAEVAAARGVPVTDVNIEDPDVQAVVVPGMDLEEYTDEDWAKVLCKKEIVFARTTPTQKLEIVERNQALGHVVAVTGDGVNDSPALKAADVGVAMGKMGSDVAREAADIILITDDFAAIQDAVRMGRLIFDNLKKSIAYTLAHLFPEVFPVLCTLAFSMPLGITSILILCIDLGTELCPAISIAYEKPESGIMSRPPRNIKTDRLVSYPLLSYAYLQAGILISLTSYIGYFLVFVSFGVPLSVLPFSYEHHWFIGADNLSYTALNGTATMMTDVEQTNVVLTAQSVYWMTLVLCQFWHIWFIRNCRISAFSRVPNNIVMIMGVIIEVAIVVIILYVPDCYPYLGSWYVPGQFWPVCLIFAFLTCILTETVKFMGRRYPDGFVARHILW